MTGAVRGPRGSALGALVAGLLLAGPVGCVTVQPTVPEAPPELVRPVRIGTLAEEDALPLWVAEADGLFAASGLDDVAIITYRTAAERDAALASGTVDAIAGDLVSAVRLESDGIPVTVAAVMLGETPSEGRFGIVAAKGSGIATLSALAGVPVGTAAGTLDDFVLDGLMRRAGVPADRVVTKDVPEATLRLEGLATGSLKAAVLPDPLLTAAVAQGGTLLADDTKGGDLSVTALVFSDAYLRSEAGIETEAKVLDAWDAGAEAVDADPDSRRTLLEEKGALPESIAETYRVPGYPNADAPSAVQVEAALAWVRSAGLAGPRPVTYESLVILTP